MPALEIDGPGSPAMVEAPPPGDTQSLGLKVLREVTIEDLSAAMTSGKVEVRTLHQSLSHGSRGNPRLVGESGCAGSRCASRALAMVCSPTEVIC